MGILIFLVIFFYFLLFICISNLLGGIQFMGKPSKFSKLQGPQAASYATLDAASETLASDSIVFVKSGVAKKVTFANVVADMDGTVTNTGLTSTDGVLSVSIDGLDAKTEPIAADSLMLCDSAATNALKEVTLVNLAKPLADTMAGTASSTGLTDSSGVLTVAAKIAHLEAALLKGVSTFTMSFETGEQTTTRIYFPMKVTIDKIRGIVMKAIAASDNGTITCGNSTGASTAGVITAMASDALNVLYSVSPSTNNVVLADGYYYLTSAKSTAGGKVLVSLEWTRTA
jgi:hypothetical protein